MNFKKILKGGDLRSIGNSNKIVSVIETQERFDELFQHLFNFDRKVVMRAADAIEKISLYDYCYLKSHKRKILKLLGSAENKELKWHLALIVSRLLLSQQQLRMVWKILSSWAEDKKESKIVRVNSLQGLFNLLSQNINLTEDLKFIIEKIEEENIPSLNARIRKLKKHIDKK